MWAEAGAQTALEEALELGGFGYPAMAVVNAKKLKFSTLRGSFSETGINEFLRSVLCILLLLKNASYVYE